MIRRLRALLAKHQVERQAFDLSQAIAEVAAVLDSEARRRRLALEVRLAPTATLVGDRIQIQQVLINLILNAMDAMADAPEGRRALGVFVERAAGGIAISVRDQGPGIAPEHLPQLFDSLHTKKKGMGLGLSIARTIVEAHGGRVWAEKYPPGQGAVFHVSLPAVPTASARSSGPV